jgi:ATP-dependent helicase/nuclease subunit A
MREPENNRYRQEIIQNLNVSMLVEAGAGSGKTTSLVDRMLALIATGKCTIDKMAAVTFTRKAAAELKGRFQIVLEEAHEKEKDDEIRDRYQAALARLELLFAGTIHSFCARLLRERPIEAELDPDFEELEEDENLILRDRCWTEYLEGLHAEEAPLLKEIMELGLDPAELIGTYQNLVLYPEVEVAGKKLEKPDFTGDKILLEKYLERSWKALPRTVPDSGWDNLQAILRQARLRCRHLDLNQDRNFIKVLSRFERSLKVTQNRWPTKEVALAEQEAFDTFKQEVVIPSLARWRNYCHYFLMELVVPAVAYFKSVREKSSLMNFHDLLLKAADLLRENPEIRHYFQERFTHILVDEFQDTDPIQAEVILYLTGDDLKEKSWRKLKVIPGSLFIVGDPKQSIYRFRRADIDTYNEVKRIIKDSGGRIVPLTANFRSLPPLCDWVNPIFKKKFPPEATPYQPVFERLDPYSTVEGGGIKQITINKVSRNNQKEIAGLDAERIASWIDWALKRNIEIIRTEEETEEGKTEEPRPEDFMILLRYKAHLPIYARALEAHGIPYEISGGGAFNESEELSHLLNLLTAVGEPEDQVALVATLRGPFFGVSDDLLYCFRKEGGIFSYLIPQDDCRDEEAKNRIGSIFTELHQFHLWSRTKPPGAALSLILDRLGIIPLAVTREMGESRAGNLLKALELTLWESSRALTSFADMVERLSEYYTDLDVEEMSVEPGKRHTVRLMNLHKAKGLEATVVFLADPLREPAHEPDIHISRTGEKAMGYFVATRQAAEYVREIVGLPPDWQEYENLEQKYQEAEEERLLYVATTRAKQLLVVSTYPEKQDKGPWKDLYPYLKEIEELESPREEIVAIAKGEITPEVFVAARNEIAEKVTKSKAPSYGIESVTSMARSVPEKMPFSEDTGKGMSWGRIIHRMLEALAKDENIDLEQMAKNLLKEEERLLSENESIVATVGGVMTSELWGRMKKAEQALVEVPFSLKTEEGEVPIIVSGTIDLAFKEAAGWVLADYKTDKVDGNLDKLVAYYRPQVEMYRKFWKEMSSENVKEAGLYFVDARKWVAV